MLKHVSKADRGADWSQRQGKRRGSNQRQSSDARTHTHPGDLMDFGRARAGPSPAALPSTNRRGAPELLCDRLPDPEIDAG